MPKKITNTLKDAKQTTIKVAEVEKVNNIEIAELKKNNTDSNKIIDLLISINDKLDKFLQLNKIKTNLTEMSLTDLNYLKELLTQNIVKNNYHGGDNELKVSSNNLIIKISEELNKRITRYV